MNSSKFLNKKTKRQNFKAAKACPPCNKFEAVYEVNDSCQESRTRVLGWDFFVVYREAMIMFLDGVEIQPTNEIIPDPGVRTFRLEVQIYAELTDISFMLSCCTTLVSVEFGAFNTGSVTRLDSVFFFCHSLREIDLSGWDTRRVTSMSHTFCGCSSLLKIKSLKELNTHNLKYMLRTFQGCSSLIEAEILDWDMTSLVDVAECFEDCPALCKCYILDIIAE